MIDIRTVPEALHREVKSRADLAGMSLSDYLPQEISLGADRPTLYRLRARLDSRLSITMLLATAKAVRA
jgi:hypothetical protein